MYEKAIKHIAIISKVSLQDPEKRKVEIPPEKSRNHASKEIDYALIYGDKVEVINKQERHSFGVAAPASAPANWKGVLSLEQVEPLRAAFRKGGTAREIGGQLFAQLLDDLDGLKPFWSPQFDRALTIGAFFWLKKDGTGDERFADPFLRRVLFSPVVNRRLLAYLRATETRLEEAEGRLKAVLEKSKLKSVAGAETAAKLRKFRETMALATAEASVGKTEVASAKAKLNAAFSPAEKTKLKLTKHLPAGTQLYEWWRTFIGHSEGVARLTSCEPLFAFIIEWFFGKVAGETPDDGEIADALYNTLYKGRGGAVLSEKKRQEDAAIHLATLGAESEAAEAEFRKEGVDPNDPVLAMIRDLAKSMGLVVPSAYDPQDKFTREELQRAAQRYLQILLQYGISEAVKIQAETNAYVQALRDAYRPFEAVYGKTLDRAQLQIIAEKAPAPAKAVWDEVMVKLTGKEKGEALGDKVRTLWHETAARAEHRLLMTMAKAVKTELRENCSKSILVYKGMLEMPAVEQVLPGGSQIGVSMDEMEEDSDKSELKLEVPETIGQTATGNASAAKQLKASKAQKNAPPPTASVSAPVPQGWDPKLFDDLAQDEPIAEETSPEGALDSLQGSAKRAAEPVPSLKAGRRDFDRVRQAIVENLQRPKTVEQGAAGAATLRALLLAEIVLATPDQLSPLGKKHSSLGVAALLRFVNTVGARPGNDNPAARKSMARTAADENNTYGVKDVPLHEIYPMSNDAKEAREELSTYVKYWRVMAENVLSAKDYIEEVEKVQKVIAAAEGKARITVFNETLKEHLGRKQIERAFVTRRSAKGVPEVAPPALVWLTKEARLDAVLLEKLSEQLMETVRGFAMRGTESKFLTSYPLWLHAEPSATERQIGLLTASVAEKLQGAPDDLAELICCLAGLPQDDGEIELPQSVLDEAKRITGREDLTNEESPATYFQLLATVFLGDELFQSRLLTSGLLSRLQRGGTPTLWNSLKRVASEGPLAEVLGEQSRIVEDGEMTSFDPSIEKTQLVPSELRWSDDGLELATLQRVWPQIGPKSKPKAGGDEESESNG